MSEPDGSNASKWLPEMVPVRRAWLIPGLVCALAILASLKSARAAQPATSGTAVAESDAAAANSKRLVAALPDAQSLAEIRRILEKPADEPSFIAVVEALGKSPWVTPELLADLIAACDRAPASQKPALFRAISSVPDRAAAQYLVSILDVPSADGPTRRGAAEALVRQTGREDLGEDAAKWRELLASCPDDQAWSLRTNRQLAEKADREREQKITLQTKLLEALRALHLATPADKRWALITSMIGDPLPCVNLLGLELTSRELSAGNRPDAKLAVQILSLLQSPDPAIREQAAILVTNLAPAGSQEAVLHSLDREHVPSTAAALLSAAARWPGPEAEDSVLLWIDPAVWASAGPLVRDSAIDAAWALYRGGMLRSPQSASRVLAALRTVNLADLNGSGVRLRAELGDQSDLESIVVLLGSKNSAQRLATAEALVSYPEYLPRILAAAREDPLLIDVAVRGVITVDPSLANFAAIEEATRRVPDQRRGALALVASVLNEDELLEAGRRLRADPALREAVLTTAADPRRIMAERTDPSRLSFTADALAELAELRIELGKYGEAIAALDALAEIEFFITGDRLRDIRTLAFIGLNRLDEARRLGARPDVWLKALEMNLDQPQAAQIASLIETNMADALTDADRAKLEQLKAKITVKPAAGAGVEKPVPRMR